MLSQLKRETTKGPYHYASLLLDHPNAIPLALDMK